MIKTFFMIFILAFMYSMVFFYRLATGLMFYYVQVVSYLGLAIISWSSVRKYVSFDEYVYKMMLYSSTAVIVYFLLGFLNGFGFTPYSTSPGWIIINVIYVLARTCGVEFLRAYIIDEYYYRTRKLALVSAILAPWFIVWFPYPLLALSVSIDGLRLVLRNILPSLLDSALSTYIVLKYGIVSSLIYNSLPQVVTRISPVLPRLPWVTESLYRLMIPLVGYGVSISHGVVPTRQRKVLMRERLMARKLIYTSVILLVAIFFAQGYLGIKLYVITSGSMRPVLDVGDVVVVCTFCRDLSVNDLVAYRSKVGVVVHRVVEVNAHSKYVITKGDANTDTDPEPVPLDNILGKVVQTIPSIGYLSILIYEAARTGTLAIAIGLAVPVLFIVWVYKLREAY